MRLSNIGLPAFKLLSSRLYDDDYRAVSKVDIKKSKAFFESIIGVLPKEPCTIVFMGNKKNANRDVLFKVDCDDDPRKQLKNFEKSIKVKLECFELLLIFLEFMDYTEVEFVLGKKD